MRSVHFTFEGARVSATAGQSIAAALLAAGIKTLSYSAKYRRPRGLRCGAGICPSCALRVNGLPGVPSCFTPVHGGETVERELPALRWLPLDQTARFTPAGFYYGHAKTLRSWVPAERVLAHLAGVSTVPAPSLLRSGSYEERVVDALVVGAGQTGLEGAAARAKRGQSVLVVERDHTPGGQLLSTRGGAETAARLVETAQAFGAELLLGAAAIGAFDEGVNGVVTDAGLIAVVADEVVHATGSYDREFAFPDGDRPGVMLAGAVRRLIIREGVRPGRTAVVAAESDEEQDVVALLNEAGTRVAATCRPQALAGAHGREAVEGLTVRTASGPKRIPCDLVVLACGRRLANEHESQVSVGRDPLAPRTVSQPPRS